MNAWFRNLDRLNSSIPKVSDDFRESQNIQIMLHSPSQTGIPPSVVQRLVERGALLMDVRTHCEYAGYHIQGSINIPYDEIGRMENFLKNLNKPVVIFSSHGRRSEIAAQKLKALGIEVYNTGSIRRIELDLNGESEYEAFHRTI